MAAVSVTYTFTNSTTSEATYVNQNFADIIAGLSDGTKTLTVSALVATTLTLSGAITVSGLSASSLVATDANKVLTSTTSGLSPTFTGLTLSGAVSANGGLFRTTATVVTGAATDKGYGIFGTSGSTQIQIDDDEIQAMNNTTPGALAINRFGGVLNLGKTGVNTHILGSFTVDENVTITAYTLMNNFGVSTIVMNSAGGYGTIQNNSADSWSLGYKATSSSSLGTAALTWTNTGLVTAAAAFTATGVSTLTGGITNGARFIDKTTSLTGNTTLSLVHSVIFAVATSASFTITLPAASGNTGLRYCIYKKDSSTNTVTVDGNASETIGGALTIILGGNTSNSRLVIICDGSNWQIKELYEEGTYTATLTGCTTSPTVTVSYVKNGNSVTAKTTAALQGTSNTTACTVTGMPAHLRPLTATDVTLPNVRDNGLLYIGIGTIGTGGTMTLNFQNTISSNTAVFTNVGNKGMGASSYTYPMQ